MEHIFYSINNNPRLDIFDDKSKATFAFDFGELSPVVLIGYFVDGDRVSPSLLPQSIWDEAKKLFGKGENEYAEI